MTDLLKRINAGEILVSDGAIGTVLFEQGLKSGQCPEAMNLTHPELLQKVAQAYAAAGADIVQTNTFGGSPLKLAEYDLSAETESINHLGLSHVRQAVGPNVIASGSCGPCGRMLVPYGDGEPAEIQSGFERQIGALIEGGVDAICIETMIDIKEAELAIWAARNISAEIPIMATMTFDYTPQGYHTLMGDSIPDVIDKLSAAGANIVGSNCGNGLDKMIEIAREFSQTTDLPLIIQSNAGQPDLVDGHLVYQETAEYFADRIDKLITIGVSIIGGCCGTTPEHVKAIRKVVDLHKDESEVF